MNGPILTGRSPALQPGALKFYEKDKPSFIPAHADYPGLILTVLVMVSSWFWEKAWLPRRQKNIADDYSNRVVAPITAARQASSPPGLEEIRDELLAILSAAVADLDSDKLSEESFESFRAIIEIGLAAGSTALLLILVSASLASASRSGSALAHSIVTVAGCSPGRITAVIAAAAAHTTTAAAPAAAADLAAWHLPAVTTPAAVCRILVAVTGSSRRYNPY